MPPELREKKRKTARKRNAKDRRPVTDAGKQDAKQNSLRHGGHVDRSLMPLTYVLLSQEVQEGFGQELKESFASSPPNFGGTTASAPSAMPPILGGHLDPADEEHP